MCSVFTSLSKRQLNYLDCVVYWPSNMRARPTLGQFRPILQITDGLIFSIFFYIVGHYSNVEPGWTGLEKASLESASLILIVRSWSLKKNGFSLFSYLSFKKLNKILFLIIFLNKSNIFNHLFNVIGFFWASSRTCSLEIRAQAQPDFSPSLIRVQKIMVGWAAYEQIYLSYQL